MKTYEEKKVIESNLMGVVLAAATEAGSEDIYICNGVYGDVVGPHVPDASVTTSDLIDGAYCVANSLSILLMSRFKAALKRSVHVRVEPGEYSYDDQAGIVQSGFVQIMGDVEGEGLVDLTSFEEEVGRKTINQFINEDIADLEAMIRLYRAICVTGDQAGVGDESEPVEIQP